ncbi:MAG: AAA family ATPase, partial [Holophagales bacterium]|nr:AAA family ATPase [Holophagales bacterium]
LRDALAIADQVLGGLEAAHRQGLVHRDLKTENIVLGDHGALKILDFGMAKSLLPNADPSVSIDGQLLGTPRAMAPEQALGLAVDARADLFSFGVLLYELLTGGVSPFRAPTALATLTRVCNQPHRPLSERRPDLPESLSALVDELLAKEPDQRPESATVARRRLTDIVEEVQGRPILQVSPPVRRRTVEGSRVETATAGTGSGHQTTERRQVTVLVCTPVAKDGASLDPEVLFDALREFRQLARAAVDSYEGHLPTAEGHRLVAYFGYPRAHEDDARRAVYAGLELLERLPRTRLGDGSHRLSVRLGVHTGPAITGGEGSEGLVLGPTLDLAHEVEQSGPHGEVRLSEVTRRLVGDYFDLEPTGTGGEESRTVRVRGARAEESRLDLPSTSPLIAREQQLSRLLTRWQEASQGSGRGVLVLGEAGIGKSRLVQALRDLTVGEARWLSVFASPYGVRSPLRPLSGLVRRLLGVDAQTPAARQRQCLEALVQEYGLEAEETVPTLLRLLDMPAGDDAPTPPPDQLKRWIFEVLIALVSLLSQKRPTVLLVEDLHWADPSTLEWLERLIDRLPHLPILLLGTCRLGFDLPWRQRGHLDHLMLEPLSSEHVLRLISKITRGEELPAALSARIVEKSDGVPLFVEEMTKAVLEAEGDSGETLSVPTTLRDSLTSRLDRLGSAKAVAQLAAIIGREVPFTLLR